MPRVTITVPEKTPQPYRFDLLREVVTVGRGPDNDIVVGCGSVSGKHSEMRRVKGGYELVDTGSTNGIKIDGIRRQTVVLHTGMTVKLGEVEFGFSLSEEELAELAAEAEASTKSASKEEKEEKDDKDDSKKNKEEKASEKSDSKKEDSKKDKDDDEDEDGPDKLPDLPPVRLDKRKEKEEQEEAKRKKAEKEKREKAAKEEKAQQKEKEERSNRRKKRESSEKSDDRDEYSESKAVTIGSGFILFTLIAAAAAFFYGAQTRHEKDTGESLLKGIVNKEDVKNDAPTEVEDKAE